MLRLELDTVLALPVRRPGLVLAPLVTLALLALWSLAGLEKDTRSDAFMAPDNPALLYQKVVEERFGLSDPLLIALVATGDEVIYRSGVLTAVNELTERVKVLPNVDREQVVSLATETLITGNEFGIEVQPALDPLPENAAEVAALRLKLEDYPPLQGHLVAPGGEATLIVVQLIDESRSEELYQAIMTLLANYEMPVGVVAHVAGEGAVSGYLGAYIDADARLLNPLAGVIILTMIAIAFRRIAPAIQAL